MFRICSAEITRSTADDKYGARCGQCCEQSRSRVYAAKLGVQTKRAAEAARCLPLHQPVRFSRIAK